MMYVIYALFLGRYAQQAERQNTALNSVGNACVGRATSKTIAGMHEV
jgi:hypothetical protein